MGCLLLALSAGLAVPSLPSPEDRAVAFLAREVPRWHAENHCYSCHNNGDAARALYTAKRLGYAVPDKALADTTRWLARPAGWDHNGGEGEHNDKVLARVQFAAALAEAMEAGAVADPKPLAKAADLVAEKQHTDGSWHISSDGVGSPASHSPALATWFARRVLLRADPQRHRKAVAAAEAWLDRREVKTVHDAAVLLLFLEGRPGAAAATRREQCLAVIRKGESRGGGWGPYVRSAPEVFDTALVLLALAKVKGDKEGAAMIRRGRAWLIAAQQGDGGWQETTRPPGGQSYAQHISTTGWAALALLATGRRP
ncbi:MAG TPA: prenyltransferase/squalene oxidase repeat-containing protein [Gemmataceae bacterium]|nr:prenyltransferase/squalene oxidase repeat-containing protein [Gemmataceae bacterium]